MEKEIENINNIEDIINDINKKIFDIKEFL